jgi:hypothetical protein
MSKFDEKVEMYKEANSTLGLGLSDELITGIAKSLGPSIYLGDASLVSGSDQSELDRVKNNFLIKKLGLTDGPALDEAVKTAVAAMGSANKSKHRVLVYGILAKHFNKTDMFS